MFLRKKHLIDLQGIFVKYTVFTFKFATFTILTFMYLERKLRRVSLSDHQLEHLFYMKLLWFLLENKSTKQSRHNIRQEFNYHSQFNYDSQNAI